MSKIKAAIEKVDKKIKRGGKRPNSGRKVGTPNKVTSDARAAIAKFVENNASRMQDWLDAVALESPEKAFNMLKDVMEYYLPKLARAEVTGAGGEDLIPRTINVHFPSTRDQG